MVFFFINLWVFFAWYWKYNITKICHCNCNCFLFFLKLLQNPKFQAASQKYPKQTWPCWLHVGEDVGEARSSPIILVDGWNNQKPSLNVSVYNKVLSHTETIWTKLFSAETETSSSHQPPIKPTTRGLLSQGCVCVLEGADRPLTPG